MKWFLQRNQSLKKQDELQGFQGGVKMRINRKKLVLAMLEIPLEKLVE